MQAGIKVSEAALSLLFSAHSDFRTARAKCIEWFPFKREPEIEPESLAAVPMLSDSNGGRPNPFVEETFAHDQDS